MFRCCERSALEHRVLSLLVNKITFDCRQARAITLACLIEGVSCQTYFLKSSKLQTTRTRSNTEQATRTDVSGLCEVLAQCEYVIELPLNAETGTSRATGRRKKWSLGNVMTLQSFWRLNRRRKPKIELRRTGLRSLNQPNYRLF